MKKYEFTGEIKNWLGRTLRQIRATVSFGNVMKGEIGGWIEKEENLAQDGNAWVYDNAQVYGNAWVCDNALVYGDARVCDNALVCDNAWVCDNALVYGDARVYGDAWVYMKSHWLCVGPIGSRNDFTTFFRTGEKKIFVKCGCFRGDIDAFVEEVRQTHGESEHAKAYMAAVELAKLRIDLSGEE